MMRRCRWLISTALLLLVADAHPHHHSSSDLVKAHRRQRHHARPKGPMASAEVQLQQQRAGHVEEQPATPGGPSGSKGTCSPEVELLRHVMGTQRSKYFKEGEPYNGMESDSKVLIPSGCERWKKEDHCCSSGFFEKLSEASTSIQDDFAFVKYQYRNFKQDVVKKAEESATEETKSRLTKAVELAEPGLEAVVDFIDKCEDPLRRFFSATACTLCTPNLDQSLTEGQTLHWSAENCTTLKKGCEGMPSRLEEAGRSFLKARDVLKLDESQELWYNHVTTWLDRAGKLSLVRSKHVEFYKTTDFCKVVEKEGYVYKPELWGDVLLLHISSLATDEEKQSFLPQNQLHFFIPKMGQLPLLKEEAERIEAELTQGGPASESEDETSGLLEVDAEDEALTLNCVNGELRGSHCACYECWSGVECNKEMPPGPYVSQEFEPLVVQVMEGAQQSLAVKGCGLHADLRHQLARITLIPGHHALEHAAKSTQDELCRVSNPHSDSLKMRIPQTVKTDEYMYLVDIPLDVATWYQVCFCYGVECTENLTSMAWYRIGEVQVVQSHQDRDEIVRHMFTPKVMRERRIVERDTKAKCSHGN